jgi:hypothetical protein
MDKRVCLLVALLLITRLHGQAQSDEQLWLDFQVDYPSYSWLFEVAASYQTLLTQENKWRSLSVTPTVEYVLLTRLDLTAELPLSYTMQEEDTSSFELSPMLGARLHITQNKRINARLFLRYQQRHFHEIEADVWDISNRIRLKGEFWISITGPNLYKDKLWYALIDYEEFFVLDDQLDERYANRRRGRIGLGYRLDYKNRFEIIYTRQSSRNEIEGEFISNDNVIQLVYKMYVNPAKVAD